MAVARWLFSPLYESHELPNMIEIILYDSCELPYMIKIIFM